MYSLVDNTTKVFQNGNSRAIRLPRQALRSTKPGDILVVEYLSDRIILHSKPHPLSGWDARFKSALAQEDMTSQISDTFGTLNIDATLGDGLTEINDVWSAKP
jgi:virulence-associated protein VagC